MRDYVLTTSCRREFLMNYFNFPLDSEQHDKDTCCDNCSNLPSDNSKQTTWQVDSALKDCCFVSLTHYFSLENQAITNCLFPSSVTGLSESVARALSSEPEKFTSAAQLSQAYPKLEESYKSNIITILQAELARFHNLRKWTLDWVWYSIFISNMYWWMALNAGPLIQNSCDTSYFKISLTHCGLVTPYGDRDLGQHWFR